ncbi:cytosine permease [Microbacterium sp. EST19A]|uniref:purine-cytosine permease family protein n=1 Tax=Microbacterium sp. EST19A TaxID=2862681 RepID=UPI001CBB090E|nr:cytosine permease [Microbacterium sp. EST19A]
MDLEPQSAAPGRVEQNGTNSIPLVERHGSPRDLFTVWAGSNVTYLYFVLGGLLVLFGLNVWQAIAVVIAGNLFFVGVGFLAITGPRSGVPSEVIGRAFFGVRGNRVLNLVCGWFVGVLYEAINLSVGATVGFALVLWFAPQAPIWVQGALVLGLALLTFTISVYGHATILRFSRWITWVLLIGIALMAFFVLLRADFSYEPAGGSLEGAPLWAVALAGFTLIASAPLSWQVGADYARYLPPDSNPSHVAFWTGFGGFLPAVAIGILGVLAGTVVDMSDPTTGMASILPSWFYPIFLVIVIVGSVANNSLTAYSTGLALLAAGVRWRRSVTVIFDAVIAVGITLYALFVSNFLDSLSGLLEVSLVILAPSMAIYVVDIIIRRNRYDGRSLEDESPGGSNWFRRGWNLAGLTALVVGAVATALFVSTTFYMGPLAAALGGADLSPIVGSLVAGGLYALLAGRRIRASLASPRTDAEPRSAEVAA